MEWLESIKKAINYIEDHIYESIEIEDICNHVNISSFYFQKGFTIMTGYSIGEYIRNRKLYLSALDINTDNNKIIDIAYKYGYETPESFTKAFYRFHGVTPMQIKGHNEKIKLFLPLKVKIEIIGGNEMNYQIEKIAPFKVIGFERYFSFENCYSQIPLFWNEVFEKYTQRLCEGKSPTTDIEKAIVFNHIGEFGICIDDTTNNNETRYLIAGEYKGGNIPKGMVVYEIPEKTWAKFNVFGPIPTAIQALNTKIFKEWLPSNLKYELDGGFNIEWYSPIGNTNDMNYESGVWLPVKEK